MSMATVAEKDGQLCIRYVDDYSTEPKRVILFWPVCRFDAAMHAEHVGKEAHGAGNGVFSVRAGSTPFSGWITLRLPEGGSTKAIATEIEPINPPKVRKGVEIRFRHGRWEKYLKSEGWVVA